MTESSHENTLDSEDRIRERAYHLWQADGRPDGRAEEYWERAKASENDEDHVAGSQAVVTHDKVPQADVAAEREIAERAGNQQRAAPPPSAGEHRGNKTQGNALRVNENSAEYVASPEPKGSMPPK